MVHLRKTITFEQKVQIIKSFQKRAEILTSILVGDMYKNARLLLQIKIWYEFSYCNDDLINLPTELYKNECLKKELKLFTDLTFKAIKLMRQQPYLSRTA